MNCIILLLLLGCCGGWGNDGCSCAACGDNGCRRGVCRGRMTERRDCGRGEPCGRDCDRDRGRGEPCGRDCDRDCGCAQDDRESCDVPGMIPPPWQEYPKFPRRDRGEDCEG